MPNWRVHTARGADRRRPGRARGGRTRRQHIAPAERAALRHLRPHRGRARDEARRGSSGSARGPPQCASRCTTRSSSSSTPRSRCCAASTRSPPSSPNEACCAAARATAATPSRRGRPTCSCRPGTRAGWRRSAGAPKGWRARAGCRSGTSPAPTAGLAAGESGTRPTRRLAALVDDEVHVNDNSLWLASVCSLPGLGRPHGGRRAPLRGAPPRAHPVRRPHRDQRARPGQPRSRRPLRSGIAALVTGRYEEADELFDRVGEAVPRAGRGPGARPQPPRLGSREVGPGRRGGRTTPRRASANWPTGSAWCWVT